MNETEWRFYLRWHLTRTTERLIGSNVNTPSRIVPTHLIDSQGQGESCSECQGANPVHSDTDSQETDGKQNVYFERLFTILTTEMTLIPTLTNLNHIFTDSCEPDKNNLPLASHKTGNRLSFFKIVVFGILPSFDIHSRHWKKRREWYDASIHQSEDIILYTPDPKKPKLIIDALQIFVLLNVRRLSRERLPSKMILFWPNSGPLSGPHLTPFTY